MYLQLLAYAIPLYDAFATIAIAHPGSYRDLKKRSEGESSNKIKNMVLDVSYGKGENFYEAIQDVVKKKIREVLEAENVKGGDYYDKIQDLINDLPPSDMTKSVEAIADSRFKVVFQSSAMYPVFSCGTCLDAAPDEGNLFIFVDPAIQEATQEVLPWIAAHEVYHWLRLDGVWLTLAKCIASFAAVTFSTFVLGGGALRAISAAFAARVVLSAIVYRLMQSKADDFANKHSSQEELEKAIRFFETPPKKYEPSVLFNYYRKAISLIYFPSEDARIAKIRGAISSRFGKEEASA